MKKTVLVLVSLLLFQTTFAQRAAVVNQDKKFGFIREDGSWLIEPTYKGAISFSDGLAGVFDGDNWGFVNSSGEMVIGAKYDKVKGFNSGLAVVAMGKKWMYINKKGEEVSLQACQDLGADTSDSTSQRRGVDLAIVLNTLS